MPIKIGGILVVLAIFLAYNPVICEADSYKIDPVHSTIVFRIQHLGVSYFFGRFNQPEGYLRIDKDNPRNSAIDIKAEVENIDTDNEKRDTHLKSPDFFDSKKYPWISFKSRSVKPQTDDKFEISGDLTLHGVSRPVTVTAVHTGEAEDPWGGYRIGFETAFSIKRSEYEMAAMQGAVGDEVMITVSVEGIREE